MIDTELASTLDKKLNINSSSSGSVYQLKDEWIIEAKLSKNSDANFCIGVYSVTNIEDPNKRVVVKIVPQNQKSEIEKDIDNILKEKHENIIKILEYKLGDYQDASTGDSHNNCLFLFMEYLDGYKTILEMLNDGHKFTEAQIRLVAHYLVYALAHLHENRIIHRDIKGSNILIHIGNDGTLDIKLIDFGLSKYYGDNKSNYITMVGTPTHTAPEVFIQNNKASRVSDIWSFGCTLLEMAGADLSNKINGIPIIPSDLSKQFKNFIQHCLIVEPEDRPKAIELIHHKFIQIDGSFLSELNNQILNNSKKAINSIELSNQQLYDSTITIEPHITRVVLPEFNNQDLGFVFQRLPTTVTHLSLPLFNHTIKQHSIPSNIQSLSIPSFNHDIEEDAIPSTITELVLGESFEFNEYGGYLPDTIKKFTCSYNFTAPLKRNNNIPKSVSTLVLNNYNYSIVKFGIPSTVHTLVLGSNYQDEKAIESLRNLPSSVINLTFGVSNDCTLTNDQIEETLAPSNIIINRTLTTTTTK